MTCSSLAVLFTRAAFLPHRLRRWGLAAADYRSNKARNEYRETSLAKTRVIVRKPKVSVTDANYKVLQFLDLLNDGDVYSEITGNALQKRLYQYMSDAGICLSDMEPYFPYYPDKLYMNLVETKVIYYDIQKY